MKLDFFSSCKAKLSYLPSLGRSSAECDDGARPKGVEQGDEASLLHDSSPDQMADVAPAETPETRQERVAELRQQIDSGTYEIPFSQLVRILASLFMRDR